MASAIQSASPRKGVEPIHNMETAEAIKQPRALIFLSLRVQTAIQIQDDTAGTNLAFGRVGAHVFS